MNSEQRKQNIKQLLKRGDLKLIAQSLGMSYSYLSQAFSPASTFNFTSELARKVEQVMGWQNKRLEFSTTYAKQPNTNGLHMMALRGRAAMLAHCFPEKRLMLYQSIKIANFEKKLDIIIYNPNGSVFLIAEQSVDYDDLNNIEQLIFMMAITGARYGVVFSVDSGLCELQEGTAFNYDDCRSRWFKDKDGKVIEASSGPDGVFEEVGI